MYQLSLEPKIKEPKPCLLKPRTGRNAKEYVHRMGYHVAVSKYMNPLETKFTGSSLNRKKNGSYQAKIFETLPGIVGETIADHANYQGFIFGLRERILDIRQNKINKQGAGYWAAPGVGGNVLRVHMLSNRSKAKVRDKFTAFYRASKRSKAFITLTFIESVSDTLAVSILNKFLTVMRKEFPDLQYIWVAERQDNGNIHFHMVINRRTSKKRLPYYNGLWLLEQYNSGLKKEKVVYDCMEIDKNLREYPKYKGTGEYFTKEEIVETFRRGHSQSIANPFNIKAINSVYHLSYYLTKYISKQSDKNAYGCRAWHCSRGVSRLFTAAVVSRSCFNQTTSSVNDRLDRKTGEMISPTIKKHPYFLCTFINNKVHFYKYLREMEKINGWIITGMPIRAGDLELFSMDEEQYRWYILNEASKN